MAIYHGKYDDKCHLWYNVDPYYYDILEDKAKKLFYEKWNTDNKYVNYHGHKNEQSLFISCQESFIRDYCNRMIKIDQKRYDRYHQSLKAREKRKKKIIEEEQKRQKAFKETPEYQERLHKEWEAFQNQSNDIVRFVGTGSATNVFIKNYNNRDYTNLNDFFGLIYQDNFWDYYRKYVKFTNDALGFAVLLFVGEMILNIIPSIVGDRSGIWSMIDLFVPVGIFIYWYYKGMEERYKLGWLIYLRNNWYDVADDQQRMYILAAIMLAGSTHEAQRYMMANVNERTATNPQPPNSIDQVLINRYIWEKVNNKGRK